MVGYNHRDFAVELTAVAAYEQVIEAVVQLADQHSHTLEPVAIRELQTHRTRDQVCGPRRTQGQREIGRAARLAPAKVCKEYAGCRASSLHGDESCSQMRSIYTTARNAEPPCQSMVYLFATSCTPRSRIAVLPGPTMMSL